MHLVLETETSYYAFGEAFRFYVQGKDLVIAGGGNSLNLHFQNRIDSQRNFDIIKGLIKDAYKRGDDVTMVAMSEAGPVEDNNKQSSSNTVVFNIVR